MTATVSVGGRGLGVTQAPEDVERLRREETLVALHDDVHPRAEHPRPDRDAITDREETLDRGDHRHPVGVEVDVFAHVVAQDGVLVHGGRFGADAGGHHRHHAHPRLHQLVGVVQLQADGKEPAELVALRNDADHPPRDVRAQGRHAHIDHQFTLCREQLADTPDHVLGHIDAGFERAHGDDLDDRVAARGPLPHLGRLANHAPGERGADGHVLEAGLGAGDVGPGDGEVRFGLGQRGAVRRDAGASVVEFGFRGRAAGVELEQAFQVALGLVEFGASLGDERLGECDLRPGPGQVDFHIGRVELRHDLAPLDEIPRLQVEHGDEAGLLGGETAAPARQDLPRRGALLLDHLSAHRVEHHVGRGRSLRLSECDRGQHQK
jgi:hypothetical protein